MTRTIIYRDLNHLSGLIPVLTQIPAPTGGSKKGSVKDTKKFLLAAVMAGGPPYRLRSHCRLRYTGRFRRREGRPRQRRHRLLPDRAPGRVRRDTTRAAGRPRLRHRRHRQGRRRRDQGDLRRRRRRPGQGGLRGQGPDRQGLQDHRAARSSRASPLQVAPIAAQNKVLFISGPAATDAITGINKYTFRSGRQAYQDVPPPATFIDTPRARRLWSSPRTALSARPTSPR